MLPLDIDPKLAWALRHPRSLPARRQPRQPRGIAARAGLRRQGGGPHHRHAPRDIDPRQRIWRGCTSRGTRRCRSSFSPTTGRRRICWTARGWRSGFGRRRRSWDLGFRWKLDALHLARKRNRFRGLAQSGAGAGAQQRGAGRRDMDRAGQRARIVRTLRATASKRRTAPSTYRPNSSNWRNPRSCTAIPSALQSCTACCGGCGATTTCLMSRPIRTSRRSRRWPRRCGATSTRCTPSSASARSGASASRISSPGSSRSITSSNWRRRSLQAASPTWRGRS